MSRGEKYIDGQKGYPMTRRKCRLRGKPRPSYDWSKVDLTRPTREIMHALGCSWLSIKYQRQKAGIPQPRKRFAWEAVDWTKRDEDIAAELGCRPSAASRQRKILGKPKQPCHKRGIPPLFAWDTVDWTKQNTVLSRELGCSGEAVRKHRIALGKPLSLDHGKQPSGVRVSKYPWDTVDWSLRDVEIGDILGCRPGIVCVWRKKHSKPDALLKYKKRSSRYSYDWKSVDWSKTDYRIAKILGCTPRAVALRRAQL